MFVFPVMQSNLIKNVSDYNHIDNDDINAVSRSRAVEKKNP